MEVTLKLSPFQMRQVIEACGCGHLFTEESFDSHYVTLNLSLLQVQSLIEQMNLNTIPEPETSVYDDILSVPITRLPFSERVIHVFQRMDVETMGDVVQLSEDKLSRTRNCGPKSMHHIRDVLGLYGLKLQP